MLSLSPLVLFNVLVSLLALSPAVSAANDGKGPGHKAKRSPSVIVVIPDGFGPATGTLAREFKNVHSGKPVQWGSLSIDENVVGSVQTRSKNNLVTDSAAAGTAFACGVSTNNSFIGYDDNRKPCANVLEGAKALGYNTGLVSTSRITHATPAAYSSHVYFRDNENLIAEQQLGGYVLGRQVDLMWGGGRRQFIPQSQSGSSRKDDKDLVKQAREQGYSVLLDRAEFDAYVEGVDKVKRNRFARDGGKGKGKGHKWHLPSVGLFTSSHMSYEIDRDESVEPSLKEMSLGALQALESNATPFFLMVEAARIDHAGHANDGGAMVWDSLAYDDAYAAITHWVSSQPNPEDYIVLAVADHETGGIVLPSGWKPQNLLNASMSTEALAAWARPRVANQTIEFARELVNGQLLPKLGVPALNGTNLEKVAFAVHNNTNAALVLAEAQSNWTGIEWGTLGHSQVDVSLHLHPRKHSKVLQHVQGSHPNVWLGQWIAEYLGMDLKGVLGKLESQGDLGGELPPAVVRAD